MRARVSVLLVLVCLATALISAQERGAIVITATDSSGAVLPGTTIEIESGTERRACLSNEQGVCSFLAVMPGEVKIRFELLGFRTYTITVTLSPAQTLRISAPLEVGVLQETITVSAESRLIDVSTSTTSASLAEPYYRRAHGDESYEDVGENPFRSVTTDPLSTFSVDVDTASYANVRRFLSDGELPPDAAVRIEELINYFDYAYPQPKGDRPFSITTELAGCPWNSKHRLALIGLQGRDVEVKDLPARNLVFLIDVSGSMMEPDKLPLVQSGLRMLADTLTANDRVSIVVYAGASGLVLPPTGGGRKAEIDRAIADLQAGGSTNGGEGIQLAYRVARDTFIKGGVNRVILATDGDFNVGITDQDELVRLIERERESGVFLSVLGVGTGNLKDSTMEKLADKGNGNYSYLDSLHEAHRVLVTEAGGTLVTIAKDVKIQVEFNPRSVNAYRLIGYENRILRDEDFNDDRKDAGEIGAGHSVTAIYEIVPAGTELDRPSIDPLKYAEQPPRPERGAWPGKYDGELLTVKLRYKAPDGDVSKFTSAVMVDRPQGMGANLGFASAVAEAGMLLRHSPHARDASFTSAIERARKFRGEDAEGYRAEFIRLIEVAASLSKQERTR